MRTTRLRAEARSQKLDAALSEAKGVRRPRTSDKWQVTNDKQIFVTRHLSLVTALSFWLLTSVVSAQQLSTQTAPIFAVNAQYVQGVAPGYWPTAGAGLVLNIASGTATCNNAPANYAGGTLTLAANATNYVYLDPNSGCAPAYNTTGFPAGAQPIATVTTNASSIAQISDQRTWFAAGTPPFVSASSFPGASVGGHIDAACASLGGKAGAVLIPYGMGSGQSLAGLASGCGVLDLRGGGPNLTANNAPDDGGNENNYSSPFLFRYRWGSAQPPDPNALQVLHVFGDYATGGSNCSPGMAGTACTDGNYHKRNPRGLVSAIVSRTPSQVSGAVGGSSRCYSQGDCVAVSGTATSFDTMNAGGDEGTVAGRFQADQGNSEFTATISSVSSNTINYTSPANENTRGEQRFLVDTGVSNSKVYSTGTVSTIASGGSGDITVTGSGVSWSSFGDGLHCFWMTHGADKYGLSIRHVFQIESGTATATSLTISFYIQNVARAWLDDDTGTADLPAGTGLYNIAPCSTVTSLGVSGSLTVANASLFAANDSIFMPLGLGTMLQGLAGYVSTTLPNIITNQALGISNVSPFAAPATGGRPVHHHLGASGNAWVADIQIGANSGVDRTGAPIPPPDYGIQFNSGHWATPFVALGVLDSSTSFPATVNLLGVQNSTGQLSLLQYGKFSNPSSDHWTFQKSLEVAQDYLLGSQGSHVAYGPATANNDFAGAIAVSAATSASHTFTRAYNQAPVCVLTPESNPGAATWWVTKSTTAVTVNLSVASTITFDYVCVGNPN